MKILVINNNSSLLDKLTKMLSDLDIRVEVIGFNELKTKNFEDYDAIILSGGSELPVLYHEKEYAQEIKLIKETAKPLLGICLGFELIAHAFNAPLKLLEEKERGIINLKIIKLDPIFNSLPSLKVYESHRWVVERLPDVLEELAKSKDGIEAIKHKTKPIYGFQFHPEKFPQDTAGDEILINFINLIKNEHHH